MQQHVLDVNRLCSDCMCWERLHYKKHICAHHAWPASILVQFTVCLKCYQHSMYIYMPAYVGSSGAEELHCIAHLESRICMPGGSNR